jgi:glutamate/tyrosine decarboxylase-like PLP-dependent enzyme
MLERMKPIDHLKNLTNRKAPLDMDGEEFRRLGYGLVDQIAEFLDGIRDRPVTRDNSPAELRKLLGSDELPTRGTEARELFREVSDLLFDNSLLNGHPKFWGYITSSAAPIGALADLLASSVNPNVGAAILSPIASEIEAQTIRWIADLIGFPRSCGGLLVSGGNMANFVGFLAATKAKAPWNLKENGFRSSDKLLVAYVSAETHTWIDKAAELFGLGKKAVRFVPADSDQRMDAFALENQIKADLADGHQPFLVVGAAGTVGTGAVDPLKAIAGICREHDLWLHVDGAYGAPAAALPEASEDLRALAEADSIALDPHKWLYAPLEAGCALVRDPRHLVEAFSHNPAYYNFAEAEDDHQINYHEYGPQNSRGFRALKVWLALRQVGRDGYVKMIGDDIALSNALFRIAESHPEIEVGTQNLSITTFRFVPAGMDPSVEENRNRLDGINREIQNRLQRGGEAFVSNAIVDGNYFLRACIVNFRTTLGDVEDLVEIVVRIGREVLTELELTPPISK